MTFHSTFAKAFNAELKNAGYQLTDVGRCGDLAIGSRRYYEKKGSKRNQFGIALETATISRIPGHGWKVSIFSEKEEKSTFEPVKEVVSFKKIDDENSLETVTFSQEDGTFLACSLLIDADDVRSVHSVAFGATRKEALASLTT